jgi:histidyl-tRNA synthetase
MKSLIYPVKGTRDFYPEEMAVRSWLLDKIRQVSKSYGYQEYEGPFLERFDLYAAKSGEELVNKQSYVFEARDGEKVTLRPELTPTLARMVAQRQKELVYPARWWMFGPFWRYEQPQKGRTREFFQWNIDMLGAATPECDAEMIALVVSFFQAVGFGPEDVCVGVSSRRLMNDRLTALGISPEMRKTAFRVIDRRDKMSVKEWEAYAIESGFTVEQVHGIQAFQTDPDTWKESEDLVRVFKVIEMMGMKDYVEFNPEVIRGLDYYTGVVFEAWSRKGGRAILGGGHYDNLIGDVGGDLLPAVGFAMGDVMITILLQELGLIPDLSRVPADTLITVFDEDGLLDAFALSAQMRSAGLKVIVYPEVSKLQKQLKYADRLGVRYVIIAGPDERAAGQVTLKDLKERTQEVLARSEVIPALVKMLAQPPAV